MHCDLRLDERFKDKSGTVLNGILFGIMDVMMWSAIWLSTGKICAIRRLDADFIMPVEYDKFYRATSQFVKIEGNAAFAIACIEDNFGNICTIADAVFCEDKGASVGEAMKRLDFSGFSPEMVQFFRSLLPEGRGDSEEMLQQPEYYPRGLL
jgi:hypothetical protein